MGSEAQVLAAELAGFLEPDNDRRKLAEQCIVKRLKQAPSVMTFMEIITMHADGTIRQLAATLLRKKIGLHWRKVPEDARNKIKQELIMALTKPQDRPPRMATAHLTALVSKLVGGQWDDLLALVDGLTQQPEPNDRELGMVLLSAMAETMPDAIVSKQNSDRLAQWLMRGLTDKVGKVQTAAMKASSAVLGLCETQQLMNTFGSVSNGMMTVLTGVIQSKDTSPEANDLIISVFDAFDEVLSRKGVPQPLIGTLVNFSVEVAREPSVSPLVRERAVGTLTAAAIDKRKTIRQMGLLQHILNVGLQLLSEEYDRDLFEQRGGPGASEEDEEDEVEDLDELDVSRPLQLGCNMLDELSMKSSDVYDYIMNAAQALVRDQNPAKRKAGIMAVAQISEGCRDKMRDAIQGVMEMVRVTMGDSDEHVCQASGYALTLFVEYLQPEILDYADDILNHTVKLLDSPISKVQEKGCFVLDTIGEDMGRFLKPRAQELLHKLVTILNQPNSNTQMVRTKAHAMASIGSLAAGVGKTFVQYGDLVNAVLQHVFAALSADVADLDTEVLSLRSHSTETLGVVVNVCGREHGDAIMQNAWPLLGKNIQIDDSQLHEQTFNCWGNIIEAYKDDAIARGWVNDTIPILLETIGGEDGNLTTKDGVFGGTNIVLEDDEDDDVEGDDEDEGEGDDIGGGQTTLRVRTADLDKRAAAIKCYGTYARVLKGKFLPYFGKEQWELLISMVSYFHSDVSSQAVIACASSVVAMCHADPNFEKTKGVEPSKDLSKETRDLVDSFLQFLFTDKVENEDSKPVIREAFDAASHIADELGVVGVWITIRSWVEATKKALGGKLLCQVQDEDEMNEDEDEDHDELMDCVLDSIDEFAKTLGPKLFPPYWQELEPFVKPFLGPKRPGSDHSMALGTYAEVARSLGEAYQPFFDKTFEHFTKGIKSKDPGARSNAVYGLGVLCKACSMQGAAKAEAVCQETLKLLNGKQPNNVHDNVVAAVARCLSVNPNIPSFNQVFTAMCAALPLREDFSEYDTLYDSVSVLIACHLDKLPAVYQSVLQILVAAFTVEGVSDKAKSSAEQALTFLCRHADANVQQGARQFCQQRNATGPWLQ